MTLVYTAPTMLMVAHVRNLLEAEGIACVVRNEFLGSGAGELPPTETWPEVWVIDDAQAGPARQWVAAATGRGETAAGEPWRCAVCGEAGEANFGACWKCGALRPE